MPECRNTGKKVSPASLVKPLVRRISPASASVRYRWSRINLVVPSYETMLYCTQTSIWFRTNGSKKKLQRSMLTLVLLPSRSFSCLYIENSMNYMQYKAFIMITVIHIQTGSTRNNQQRYPVRIYKSILNTVLFHGLICSRGLESAEFCTGANRLVYIF
jgi:hypothetical protein